MVRDLRSFLSALAPFPAVTEADADAFRCALMQTQASNVESFNVRMVFNSGGDILLTQAHVVSVVAVMIASLRSIRNRGCTIEREMKKLSMKVKHSSVEAQGYRCHGLAVVDVEVMVTNQHN